MPKPFVLDTSTKAGSSVVSSPTNTARRPAPPGGRCGGGARRASAPPPPGAPPPGGGEGATTTGARKKGRNTPTPWVGGGVCFVSGFLGDGRSAGGTTPRPPPQLHRAGR